MQEVKIGIVQSGSGNVAKLLKQYIAQGYTVDAFSVEVASTGSQTSTVTTVMHTERNGQWN